MEYNPIAINEALAYSFLRNKAGTPTATNRFYVELVNTLSQTAIGLLPANDFGAGVTNPPDVSTLDLSLANYDMVMTADDPVSRPDPFTGQLLPIATANYYGQIPLNTPATVFSNNGAAGVDVQLNPLYAVGPPSNPPQYADFSFPPPPAPPPNSYFYVISNLSPDATSESAPVVPVPPGTAPTYPLGPRGQTLASTYDPLALTPPSPLPPPPNVVPPGYCPNLLPIVVPSPATPPPAITGKTNFLPPNVPAPAKPNTMLYYWICLRRPANPFAPPQPDISLVDANNHSTYNPMVVVDALRFPYIEGSGTPGTPPTKGSNTIYSSQRCQPFRGGHAVRLPGDTTSSAAPLYTPYGYSEQMAQPATPSSDFGQYGGTGAGNAITQIIYHTIGLMNDQPEPWDYFPFNDRDFTSVAELMLVPGCPPGLFTKQFVELAPMPPSTTFTPPVTLPLTQFPVATPPPNPPTPPSTALPTLPNASLGFPAATGGTAPAPPGTVAQPHTYPYLVDKFFYSGYGGPVPPATIPAADPGGVVDGPGADGWFKMFEFFEVPSQSLGAIGPVAQGTNFDWARQDMKPGLLNLNLIIDEEVFLSVLGSQSITLKNGVGATGPNTDSFSQNLLNFAQLPAFSPDIPRVVIASLGNLAPASLAPIWGFGGSQPALVTNDPVSHPNGGAGGAFNGMKAAFAQFLMLRHAQQPGTRIPTPLLFSLLPERPFHSLSYPDINYTVVRPANLPPASTTYNPGANGYNSATYAGDPGVRNPYIYPPGPTSIGPTGAANTVFAPGTLFNGVTTNVTLPTPIPARQLFQIPDAYGPAPTYPPAATPTPPVSNASDSGDPFINVVPVTVSASDPGGGSPGAGGRHQRQVLSQQRLPESRLVG